MSSKLEVIQNNPKLFKKFKRTVERGRWLCASVILCAEEIEVYFLPTSDDSTKETTVTTFVGYTEDTFAAVTQLLNERAEAMKKQWLPHYEQFNRSASEGWALDLCNKDTAVLEIGNVENLQRCRLSWSYNGLKKLADWLATMSNTDLEDED